MEVCNRWGTPVDPVPFLVVFGTAFASCYSFGPVYLLAFDVSVPAALGASTVVFVLAVAGAYHRLVWTYRPEYREEVPVGVRFQRLVLVTAAGVGVLALLSLPFFAR
jgi:hypothetical protein